MGRSPALEVEQVLPLVQLGIDDSPRRDTQTEGLSHEQALIEIPADINALERQSSEIAFEWREATRWAFTEALAAGYLVTGFFRQRRGGQRLGTYLLSRGRGLGDFG